MGGGCRGEEARVVSPLLSLSALFFAFPLRCFAWWDFCCLHFFGCRWSFLRPPAIVVGVVDKDGRTGRRGRAAVSGAQKRRQRQDPRHSSSSSSSWLLPFLFFQLLNQELLDRQLEGLDLALELRPFVGSHGARDDLFGFLRGKGRERRREVLRVSESESLEVAVFFSHVGFCALPLALSSPSLVRQLTGLVTPQARPRAALDGTNTYGTFLSSASSGR